MYWPKCVPNNAMRVQYVPLNGREAIYYVWNRDKVMHLEHSWGWHALGNNGFAGTQKEAEELSKRWIRDRQ